MSDPAGREATSLVNLNDGNDRPRCRCPLAKGGVEHYRTDRCPESPPARK